MYNKTKNATLQVPLTQPHPDSGSGVFFLVEQSSFSGRCTYPLRGSG